MLRISRDHRLQSRSGRAAVHCRHIILGTGALLAAVMAAAPPAVAIDRVIGFQEAQMAGAVFETIGNSNNCSVNFLPGNNAEVSVLVAVNCASASRASEVRRACNSRNSGQAKITL
jgi:predicted aconitase